MTRLEEIRERYALQKNYLDWKDLCETAGNLAPVMAKVCEDIATRYARECVKASLEKAGEAANVIHTGTEKVSWEINDIIADKGSITHESNITLI